MYAMTATALFISAIFVYLQTFTFVTNCQSFVDKANDFLTHSSNCRVRALFFVHKFTQGLSRPVLCQRPNRQLVSLSAAEFLQNVFLRTSTTLLEMPCVCILFPGFPNFRRLANWANFLKIRSNDKNRL